MAKQPPETKDRFRIVCEVDEQTMGTVVKVLTRMGLPGIGFELITDIAAWNRNGARTVHETSAQEEIIAYTKDHPSFQTDEIVAHFEARGRKAQAAYGALRTLVEKKMLSKIRPGNYQRIDGLLAAPEKPAEEVAPAPETAASTAKKKRGATPRYEISNKDIILGYVKSHKNFTIKDIEALMAAEGRPANSASPVISRLMHKDKLVEMVEPGKYRRATKAAANG